MKQLILLLFSLFVGQWAFSQAHAPDALVAGGGSTNTLCWTIGQSYTKQNSFNNQLVWGFQQADLNTIHVKEITLNPAGCWVFPNPVAHTLKVAAEMDMISTEYQIHNTFGQVVAKDQLKNNNTIDVSQLKPGHYILSLQTDKGQTYIFQIIKK